MMDKKLLTLVINSCATELKHKHHRSLSTPHCSRPLYGKTCEDASEPITEHTGFHSVYNTAFALARLPHL